MTDTYVLTAGGTGGHVFPAQALAEELINRGEKVCFVTDGRGGNFSQRFPDAECHCVSAGAYAGLGKIGKLIGAVRTGFGLLQALVLLKKIKPAAVIGFGGYASVPTAYAAEMLGIPVLLHEQNSVLGGANRFLAKKATLIATTFPHVARIPDGKETVYTGVPVRPAILKLSDAAYTAASDKFNLLIFGGSQGARILSDVVPKALSLLPDEVKSGLNVAQQARAEDLPQLSKAYENSGLDPELALFFSDMDKRLERAHLVICRAGASTLAELCTAGRPALIVPILRSPDSHQLHNAEFLAENNAAFLKEEPEFTPESLRDFIMELFREPKKLILVSSNARRLAKPDAVSLLADAALKIGRKNN